MKLICLTTAGDSSLILWNLEKDTWTKKMEGQSISDFDGSPVSTGIMAGFATWHYAAEIELEDWDFKSLMDSMKEQKLENPWRGKTPTKDFKPLKKKKVEKNYLVSTNGQMHTVKGELKVLAAQFPGATLYELGEAIVLPSMPSWFKRVKGFVFNYYNEPWVVYNERGCCMNLAFHVETKQVKHLEFKHVTPFVLPS